MVDVNTKFVFYMNFQTYFTSTKINIIDAHAKFASEWQPLIGVNIVTGFPNTMKT